MIECEVIKDERLRDELVRIALYAGGFSIAILQAEICTEDDRR